jgi:AAHS family 4-hydroxybenzoate transporter-like MFS transporter
MPHLDLPEGTQFSVREHKQPGFLVQRLFTEGRAGMTMLLWIIFFMSLLDLYFLNSWLPTVLHDSGLPLETALRVTAMFQVGGVIGTLALGQAFDRTKSFLGLAAAYAGAALCVFLIGRTESSLLLQAALVFSAGICVVGAQTGSNAMAAQLYPTFIRSTGVGWSLGIGRMGSIVGPMLGAVLLSSNLQMKSVFATAAVPPVIAMAAALAVIRRAPHPRTQDL